MSIKQVIKTLPSAPGVYLFKNSHSVLYVGKSINIKARVKSHFENAKLDIKESVILNESIQIDTILTDSDFNAIVLESELIKKYQPKYNFILKDGKSFLYLKITITDIFPKVLIVRKENDKKSIYFGPFSSMKLLTKILKDIRKIIPYCTQKNISKIPCFYSKINLCNPCPNMIELHSNNVEYYKKLKYQYKSNIKLLLTLLKGKSDWLIKHYKNQLKLCTIHHDFENAIIIRDKLIRLDSILHKTTYNENLVFSYCNNSQSALKSLFTLLSKYFNNLINLKRIECFDISTLYQHNSTASMVVFVNGVMDNSLYKRFKIKNLHNVSDTQMIQEIIERRFQNNWPQANLIVIDGGKPQVRTVYNIFIKLKKAIPFIGIAKHPDRLIIGYPPFKTIKLPNHDLGLNVLRLLRDESHRFAKKYHLLLREKDFLL